MSVTNAIDRLVAGRLRRPAAEPGRRARRARRRTGPGATWSSYGTRALTDVDFGLADLGDGKLETLFDVLRRVRLGADDVTGARGMTDPPGSMRAMTTPRHHAHRLRRAHRHRPRGGRMRFYAEAFGCEVHASTDRRTPASRAPTEGRGRWPRLDGQPPRHPAARWCSSTPTTSTRPSAPMRDGRRHGSHERPVRLPGRSPLPLRRPERERAGGLVRALTDPAARHARRTVG